MKIIRDYQYVYDNWYVKSCENHNETPVLFSVYLRIVPEKQIEELKQMLDQGKTP
jgi:hypothetical protein